jgi:hypothetical protein
MPLRPDLGGFGKYRYGQDLDLGQGAEADSVSRQDESLWTKFPSWILQDSLLEPESESESERLSIITCTRCIGSVENKRAGGQEKS